MPDVSDRAAIDTAITARAGIAFSIRRSRIIRSCPALENFGLTPTRQVDKLAEHGAIVIATPLKIERGSGSPVRPFAIVPTGAGGDQGPYVATAGEQDRLDRHAIAGQAYNVDGREAMA
jgi:hypothetical protein